MKINKTIVITGTHHTPAIELIRILKLDSEINWHVEYISHTYPTESHIKHTIIPKLNLSFHDIDCGKFDRNNLITTLTGIPKTIVAIFRSLTILKRIKPDIVVSFGGYVSVPVIIASYFIKVPSITHEQTLTISLSTKINSVFSNIVALSFNNHVQNQKYVLTGNLLRQEIFNPNSNRYQSLKQKITLKPLLYITGGNQGSKFINELTYAIIDKLNNYTVLHQTGTNVDQKLITKLKTKYSYYFPTEFVEADDIGWVMNNCSLIISRSGANICQEIFTLNKKSILIPLPNTQQNEQEKNAQWVMSKLPERTVILKQEELTPVQVLNVINNLSTVPSKLRFYKNSSRHPLIDVIHQFVKKN